MEFDGVWQSKIAAVSGRNGLKAFLYQRDRVAMSALGQKRTFHAAVRESALPPESGHLFCYNELLPKGYSSEPLAKMSRSGQLS